MNSFSSSFSCFPLFFLHFLGRRQREYTCVRVLSLFYARYTLKIQQRTFAILSSPSETRYCRLFLWSRRRRRWRWWRRRRRWKKKLIQIILCFGVCPRFAERFNLFRRPSLPLPLCPCPILVPPPPPTPSPMPFTISILFPISNFFFSCVFDVYRIDNDDNTENETL